MSIQVNSVNPKLVLIGKQDNGRVEYAVSGARVSVAEYNKKRFEKTMNDYLNASDKYYSQSSTSKGFRALGQIILLGAGTVLGAMGGNKLFKNSSNGIKTTASICAGFAGFVAGSLAGKIFSTPGYSKMKENAKILKTIDASPVKD